MARVAVVAWGLLLGALTAVMAQGPPSSDDWTAPLREEVRSLGKPSWQAMLAYDVEMHRASTHPAEPPFAYPWEDTGRGYGYGPAFGSWDVAHEILDVLPVARDHAREELLNDVRLQQPSGFLPGLYWMRKPQPGDDPRIYDPAGERFSPTQTHPPLWVVAADEYMDAAGDRSLMPEFLDHLTRQIAWFERERRAKPGGFLYLDIVDQKWESGVDQGVRFDGMGRGRRPTSTACVDATAHVYLMYMYATKWAGALHRETLPFRSRADELRSFMQTRLWSERDGLFYDSWVLDAAPDGPRGSWNGKSAPGRAHSFEGMWPMVVGAATEPQGRRVIDEWLMRPDRFFTPHPIGTVAATDRKFERRMWRGPAWNSMTYWAARGSILYGRRDDAQKLLGAALDDTAVQFERSGKLWEYYDAMGGPPEDLKRKLETARNMPFPDYMGHNPLLAMARLWDSLQTR